MTENPQLQTFDVEVTQRVRVTLNPAKFTPKFMAEFRESFYPLHEIGGIGKHRLMARAVQVRSWNGMVG